MEDTKHSKLRRFNDLLTVVVIILAVYVIAAPFLPQFTYWAREKSPAKTWASESKQVQEQANSQPAGNTLFIPKIGVSEAVQEGGAEKLQNGVLRRSHTSTPDDGGNTVIVGHRFMYDVRGTFYHLDKLEQGDEIFVHWNEKKYRYTVTDTFVVTPEQVEVEADTEDDRLTLYTCTPLWSAKNRLVVQASLQEVE